MEKSQHNNFDEGPPDESASVACSNVRLWKLDTQKEWRNTSWRLWIKGLRKILWVLWTANKTNDWVLNKAGVQRELLNTDKARNLAHYGNTMRKQRSCLEKDIMHGTMPGAHRRGRSCMAWMDNINMWTGVPMKESIRMTDERDKWRKDFHGVANPGITDGYKTEQNRLCLDNNTTTSRPRCLFVQRRPKMEMYRGGSFLSHHAGAYNRVETDQPPQDLFISSMW